MSRTKNIRKSVDIKHMYVGLDLHKATINAVVMDEYGTVLNEVKIKSEPDSLRNFSDSIPFGSDIAIESSSTWYWAYRILSERHNVALSNPLKTKAIAESKVKVDSLTLANLLRGGYIIKHTSYGIDAAKGDSTGQAL